MYGITKLKPDDMADDSFELGYNEINYRDGDVKCSRCTNFNVGGSMCELINKLVATGGSCDHFDRVNLGDGAGENDGDTGELDGDEGDGSEDYDDDGDGPPNPADEEDGMEEPGRYNDELNSTKPRPETKQDEIETREMVTA